MESHWKRSLVLSLITLVLFVSRGHANESVKFDKQTLTLGGKKITVEVAKTSEQHEYGLMFRKSLPANGGMLFVFSEESVKTFWMKDTLIDLSIGYFDKDQALIDIQEMVPVSPMDTRPRTYPSAKPAMYALEMNKGWFAKNKIKLGQRFKLSPQLLAK
jgi:uncharacterized membrane protein (UPF0127 family)